MRFIVSLLFLLLGTGVHASEAPTILLFGDSLSAGYGVDVDQSWAALLQARLEEQGYEHRVVNASISGETTAGGAARIETALDKFAPKLIILELGGNDGLRGFPTAGIRDNLARIVHAAKATGAEVVLLGIRIPTNYGARYTEAFESIYEQVAAEEDVPMIEFFMDGIAMNDELLQEDRIHPNEAAQPLLLDNAWPIISQALDP